MKVQEEKHKSANTINNSRRGFLRWSAAACAAGLARPLSADEPAEVPDIDERLRRLALDAPLSMQFAGGDADDCREWQEKFSAVLRRMLGPYRPPKTWKTSVEDRAELADHRRDQLVLEADGFPPLPVYLLSPLEKSEKPRAGVLAIHGHGDHGYHPVAGRDDLPGVAESIAKANYDYGRQLARRGYVVAVPCLTPFGRRLGDRSRYGKSDPCGVTFVRMQLLGRVLMAENLRDCLWAFELLARRKDVDAGRLGCAGLSYGGRMTMLTAALEPRIRAAIVSGALNVMQERIQVRYSCGAQVIPGLLQYGDVPEISSLIAPRHCVWEVGSQDGLIKTDWAQQALQRIGRAYQAYDAGNHLLVDRFEGGHRFSGKIGFPVFDEVLGESA